MLPLSLLIVILATGLTIFFAHSNISTRFSSSESLEHKSLSERQLGFSSGWRLFLKHPLMGVGPGATAYALQSQVIPHSVPLLMLDEIGILGLVGLLLIGHSLLKGRGRWRELSGTLFLILIILSLFDHYLWSLWSGRALLFLVFALLIINKNKPTS